MVKNDSKKIIYVILPQLSLNLCISSYQRGFFKAVFKACAFKIKLKKKNHVNRSKSVPLLQLSNRASFAVQNSFCQGPYCCHIS